MELSSDAPVSGTLDQATLETHVAAKGGRSGGSGGSRADVSSGAGDGAGEGAGEGGGNAAGAYKLSTYEKGLVVALTGVGPTCDAEILKAACSEFGPVDHVNCSRGDSDAFVCFERAEDAIHAAAGLVEAMTNMEGAVLAVRHLEGGDELEYWAKMTATRSSLQLPELAWSIDRNRDRRGDAVGRWGFVIGGGPVQSKFGSEVSLKLNVNATDRGDLKNSRQLFIRRFITSVVTEVHEVLPRCSTINMWLDGTCYSALRVCASEYSSTQSVW
jgi:hypothetical protein